MAKLNDLIEKKTSKISSTQTFLLAILFMLGTGYYQWRSQNIAIDKSDKIITLLTQLNDKNVNEVSKEAAIAIYEKTFKAAACEILDKSMHTLSVNHVNDYERQRRIRSYYTKFITNMYVDDKEMLAGYKHKGARLDGVMSIISPNTVIENVLSIMFNENMSTNQKRLDIREYLYSTFNGFNNKAKINLKTK